MRKYIVMIFLGLWNVHIGGHIRRILGLSLTPQYSRFWFAGIFAGLFLTVLITSTTIVLAANEVDSSEPTAAELVKAVRENENWIHRMGSLQIRIEGIWTHTEKGIAATRTEYQKQFPDMEITPEQFRDLKPTYTETLEYAIDQQRFRFLIQDAHSLQLKIWDGKQAMVHEKYSTYEQENYFLSNTPQRIGKGLFYNISWLRAQPHSFWWDTSDVEVRMKYYGRPEEYVLTGNSNYRGIDCYILEWDPGVVPDLADGLSYRWYVGIKDHRLYGHEWLTYKKPHIEHWTLNYKEIVPDCWFPMTQGYEIFAKDDHGEQYLKSRRDLNVLEVNVNQILPDKLFEMEFKEGVTVVDDRYGAYVTYPYKANRTDEEWAKIAKKAQEKTKQDTKEKQARDVLIGKPAIAFPADATWLNSEPLIWENLRGKVVILDFFSESCGPCRNDLPYMSDMHKEREESGIVVIGIHTPGSKMEDIQKVMQKYKLKYPICIDAPKLLGGEGFGLFSGAYGVNAIPYAFVIDKEGNVAGHGWGVLEVTGKAQELLKGSVHLTV